MKSKHDQLWKSLSDPDFRKQFIEAHVDEGIAFQIRSLRINNKKQTQPEFAKELGVKQPLVSSWENPAYGNYSLNTLKKLAKAFDVGLLVRFVPFSTMVDWTVGLNGPKIAPPSFNEEHDNLKMGTIVGALGESDLSIDASSVYGFDKLITDISTIPSTAHDREKEPVHA